MSGLLSRKIGHKPETFRGVRTMISNVDKAISHFGYWPEFADGRIERFEYVRSGCIAMSIRYIDGEKGIGALVTLSFSGVSEVDLSELRSENIIDTLHISGQAPIQVRIEACYGLDGSFNCEAVAVTELLPDNSLKVEVPDGR